MGYKTRLFLYLWLFGVAGVLSLLLLDLPALIEAIPNPSGERVEMPPPWLFKLLSIIQPTVLLTVAVLVGTWLADKVGLHAPAAEAAAGGGGIVERLKPQVAPGIAGGLASGIAIVLCWVVAKPFLSAEFVSRSQEFNNLIPAAVRFLYGGFTEELLLRWGVMTLLVWLGWRLLQGGKGEPKAAYFLGAIIISAVMFGVGHLPLASILAGALTAPLVIYVIAANAIVGLIAGFLYWKKGLESAMTAHASAHVVLIIAVYLSF